MSKIEAIVKHEYVTDEVGKINIKVGEKVEILEETLSNGWLIAKTNNGEGYIPADYVEIIKKPNQTQQQPSVSSIESDDSMFESSDHDDDENKSTTKSTTSVNPVFSPQISDKYSSHMPKSFMKYGGKDFIMGKEELSPKIEAVVELSNSICEWKPMGPTQSCKIISNTLITKNRGLRMYTTYQILCSYTNTIVSRRYCQFDWLYKQLTEKYTCIVIPPLPSKLAVGNLETEFVENRQKYLQKWLTHIIAHPVLRNSESLIHFLSMTEKHRWRCQKIVIEKDKYKGGNFYHTIEFPQKEINLEIYSKRIEKVSDFIENFERRTRLLQKGFNDFQKLQKGRFQRDFQKIGANIIHFSNSMILSPDNDNEDVHLIEGILKTGNVFKIIGNLFNKKALIDCELLKEDLDEVNQTTKEIPGLISLSKFAFFSLESTIDRLQPCKFNLENTKTIDKNVQKITKAVEAELEWLRKKRQTQIKSIMTRYLRSQIQLYSEITTVLEECLSTFQ